jgi:hypothetical protein
MAGALGRRVPEDDEHIVKYPLTASTMPTIPTPVVLGVNWYSAFDSPQKDSQGHYWIGRDGKLGSVRGGHCVCLKPKGVSDTTGWWDFYNQGAEGACVGFGTSRAVTLMNRKRYFARWLWDQAKLADEWSDTNPGDDNGTSVRAGLGVLKDKGHITWQTSLKEADDDWTKRQALTPIYAEGINAYRWATSVDDALAALGYTGLDYVDMINSWGRSYPHLTRMPATVLARLLKEDGEVGLVTDR